MIGAAEWWLQVSRATPTDREKIRGELVRVTLLALPLQTLPQRGCHHGRQAFAGQFREFGSQPMSILALDVQLMAHDTR